MFDIATKRELYSFPLGDSGSIPSVEFDARGQHVVASGPGAALNAVHIATGKKTVIDEGIGWVAEYRFSPDGRYMATAGTGGIIIWDARTWKELRRVGGDVISGGRGHVGFSRDGRYVAAIDAAGHLHFWDPATGQDIHTVGDGLRPDGPVEFTHDGRVLAQAADGTIRVFGPRAGPPLRPTTEGK